MAHSVCAVERLCSYTLITRCLWRQ